MVWRKVCHTLVLVFYFTASKFVLGVAFADFNLACSCNVTLASNYIYEDYQILQAQDKFRKGGHCGKVVRLTMSLIDVVLLRFTVRDEMKGRGTLNQAFKSEKA